MVKLMVKHLFLVLLLTGFITIKPSLGETTSEKIVNYFSRLMSVFNDGTKVDEFTIETFEDDIKDIQDAVSNLEKNRSVYPPESRAEIYITTEQGRLKNRLHGLEMLMNKMKGIGGGAPTKDIKANFIKYRNITVERYQALNIATNELSHSLELFEKIEKLDEGLNELGTLLTKNIAEDNAVDPYYVEYRDKVDSLYKFVKEMKEKIKSLLKKVDGTNMINASDIHAVYEMTKVFNSKIYDLEKHRQGLKTNRPEDKDLSFSSYLEKSEFRKYVDSLLNYGIKSITKVIVVNRGDLFDYGNQFVGQLNKSLENESAADQEKVIKLKERGINSHKFRIPDEEVAKKADQLVVQGLEAITRIVSTDEVPEIKFEQPKKESRVRRIFSKMDYVMKVYGMAPILVPYGEYQDIKNRKPIFKRNLGFNLKNPLNLIWKLPKYRYDEFYKSQKVKEVRNSFNKLPQKISCVANFVQKRVSNLTNLLFLLSQKMNGQKTDEKKSARYYEKYL